MVSLTAHHGEGLKKGLTNRRTMREDRFLALISFLLALIAGLLLLLDAARVPRDPTVEEILLGAVIPAVIGLGMILSGASAFGRRSMGAGTAILLLGIVALVLNYGLIPGVLGLVAGVLGIVAAALNSQRWSPFRFRP
jgi:uncharacterized membrane protein HdeD (DUF308 family)